MIDIEYIVASPVIDAARIGTGRGLQVKADELDPLEMETNRRTQYDIHQEMRHSVIYAHWFVGRIRTPLITDANLPNWQEFLYSALLNSDDQPFRILALNHRGINKDIDAYLDADRVRLPRKHLHVGYTAEIPFRVVSGSYP